MNAKEAARNEALAKLRELCPEGSTIYSVLRHVARSGMSRRIDFYVIRDNRPLYLTSYIANALDRSHPQTGPSGLVENGAGMDMGFHVVNSLCYALWGMKAERAGYQIRHEWL